MTCPRHLNARLPLLAAFRASMNDSVVLLITNSYDTTADILVHRLGREKVLSFNFDIWSDYAFEITPSRFRIADPTGRSVETKTVAKALWRKPWSRVPHRPSSRTDEDRYYEEEVWYAVRDIVIYSGWMKRSSWSNPLPNGVLANSFSCG